MIFVKRSEGAPKALAEGKSEDRYRSGEVVARLVADFYGKCYICETKPVTDPEVEHLHPHKGGAFLERKYDWENLFYSCRHCNMVKARSVYDEGIIDCCKRDPEDALEQCLEGDAVLVGVKDPADAEAVRTAQLIEEVFNSDRTELRSQASAARMDLLQTRMNALYSKLGEYHANPNDPFAKRSIVALLSREEAFAGFTRQYVRSRIKDYPELEGYLECSIGA